MANILIYSNNPYLIAECTHALIVDHVVGRLLSVRDNFHADAVIIDAKKLDDDPDLLSIFAAKSTRFLVLGTDWPEQSQIEVLVRGAAGYCEQSEAVKMLGRVIDHVLKGDIWMRRALVPKVIGVLAGNSHSKSSSQLSPQEIKRLIEKADSLSARELEVADMIRRGENNKNIAQVLNISERTVKAHLSSIFKKFSVDDRLHLAVCLKEIDKYR